jgi:site-specific DNA recombinase
MDFIVNKDIKGRKTIEYCRKSTESEDRQVFSLDDQHEINKKTAERYDLKVIKVYKESASAKQRGRPLFNEMVTLIEEEKAEIILTWALNRLARNAVDGALLIELMDQNKLFAIVTPGKVYYNSGE